MWYSIISSVTNSLKGQKIHRIFIFSWDRVCVLYFFQTTQKFSSLNIIIQLSRFNGNSIAYWTRDPVFYSRLWLQIFFLWRIISWYRRTRCFCLSVSFFPCSDLCCRWRRSLNFAEYSREEPQTVPIFLYKINPYKLPPL